MNETLFYVFGLALTVAAVVIAFIGIRFDRFPASRPVLLAGAGIFVALVLATTAFAWLSAEDEQEHREHELAEAEAENLEEGDTTEAAEEGATTLTTGTASTAEGEQVYADQGCGGCHTLSAAESTGTTGPVLDSALADSSREFIETAIVDPNSDVARGYPPDVMPQNYEDVLSPQELEALVDYLQEATASKG